MKGVVFNMFAEMVETRLGLDVWDELLERCQPESGGIYTSVDTYTDEELISMVVTLNLMTGTPVPDLVKAFGEFSLEYFAKHYADFFVDKTAKQFLQSVHGVIHVEVKKLYPDAFVPVFEYEDPAADQLVMIYKSPRKLFKYAEGLINGVANHYGITININMLPNEVGDECRFELQFA